MVVTRRNQHPKMDKEKWTRSIIYLHGFTDVSETAYIVVVYMKIVDHHNLTKVTLFTPKTQVAPNQSYIRTPSELCGGAILLASLLNHRARALSLPAIESHTWTDSFVALARQPSPKEFSIILEAKISIWCCLGARTSMSMKRLLYKSLGTTLLALEEMTTTITSLETCLCAPLLTALTDDHNDFSVFIPCHFKIGSKLNAPWTPMEL